MNASEYAREVLEDMKRKGYPYLSPELWDDIPNCPPQIQVWFDRTQTIRVVSFADDEAGLAEALRYSRDCVNVLDHPEYGWPEARCYADGKITVIEGWGDEAPPES